MALATRCPACSTVFRISTAQATAKGGTVRCGQCRHVFNSLDALVRVEDLEVIEEVQVATVDDPTATRPVEAVEAVGAIGAVGEVGASEADSPESTVAQSDEPMANSLGPDPATVEAPSEEDPVEPVRSASDDPPVAGAWWLPDPAESPALPLVFEPPSESTTSRDDAGRLLSGRRTDLPTTGIDPQVGPAFLAEERPLGRKARWALGIGALVATIVLAGQLAYLWRDELAVRWTSTRPFLTAACVPLRCTVGYPAHLDWITIESATIQTTGAGLDVYVLNALLRNRASADVRYPHLELVLTDLQDRPILRRALRPEDYLPAGRDTARDAAGRFDDARTGFAADSELPIHLTFELGDLRFAGYRVDKFYP